MKLKKFLIGTSVAAAVIGGGIVLPATAGPTAPASAMNVCKTYKTTHIDAKCLRLHPNSICVYYTYEEVCTRY